MFPNNYELLRLGELLADVPGNDNGDDYSSAYYEKGVIITNASGRTLISGESYREYLKALYSGVEFGRLLGTKKTFKIDNETGYYYQFEEKVLYEHDNDISIMDVGCHEYYQKNKDMLGFPKTHYEEEESYYSVIDRAVIDISTGFKADGESLVRAIGSVRCGNKKRSGVIYGVESVYETGRVETAYRCLYGEFLAKYEAEGGLVSKLSYPCTDIVFDGYTSYMDFRGGVIYRNKGENIKSTVSPVINLEKIIADKYVDTDGSDGSAELYIRATVKFNDHVLLNNKRFPDGGGTSKNVLEIRYKNKDENLRIPLENLHHDDTLTIDISVYDSDKISAPHAVDLVVPGASLVIISHDDEIGKFVLEGNIKNSWLLGVHNETPLTKTGKSAKGNKKAAELFYSVYEEKDYDLEANFLKYGFWNFDNYGGPDHISPEIYYETFSNMSKPWISIGAVLDALNHPVEVIGNGISNSVFYGITNGMAKDGNCFGLTLEALYALHGRSNYSLPLNQYFPILKRYEPGVTKLYESTELLPQFVRKINGKHLYQVSGKYIKYTAAKYLLHEPFMLKLSAEEIIDIIKKEKYAIVNISKLPNLIENSHTVLAYDYLIESNDRIIIYVADTNNPYQFSSKDGKVTDEMLHELNPKFLHPSYILVEKQENNGKSEWKLSLNSLTIDRELKGIRTIETEPYDAIFGTPYSCVANVPAAPSYSDLADLLDITFRFSETGIVPSAKTANQNQRSAAAVNNGMLVFCYGDADIAGAADCEELLKASKNREIGNNKLYELPIGIPGSLKVYAGLDMQKEQSLDLMKNKESGECGLFVMSGRNTIRICEKLEENETEKIRIKDIISDNPVIEINNAREKQITGEIRKIGEDFHFTFDELVHNPRLEIAFDKKSMAFYSGEKALKTIKAVKNPKVKPATGEKGKAYLPLSRNMDKTVSAKVAARCLGCSTAAIYKYCKSGELKDSGKNASGRWEIPEKSVAFRGYTTDNGVYVSNGGIRYHSQIKCVKENGYMLSERDALSAGKTPCKRCYK